MRQKKYPYALYCIGEEPDFAASPAGRNAVTAALGLIRSGLCQVGPLCAALAESQHLSAVQVHAVLSELSARRYAVWSRATKRSGGRTYGVSVLELTPAGERMFRPAVFTTAERSPASVSQGT